MSIKNIPMRITKYCLALAAAVLMLGSCAKAEPEDSKALEKLAFDAWVQKYVLDRGIAAVEQSNGMYVEFIEDGDQTMESSRDTVTWLRLDYTAKDIVGNVFVTRDSTEALRQRSFTPLTYYVPDYLFCGPSVYGMSPGRHFALRNNLKKPDGTTMKMSEGSKVRLYLPPYLAYGTKGFSNNQGYGGQYSLDGSKIVIEELTVAEIVKNPLQREEELVNGFAASKWGLSPADTLSACFYLDTLFTPSADLLEQFPIIPYNADDKLSTETTAKIRFIGKFLPSKEYPEGFIFDTNIGSVSNTFYNRRADEDYIAGERTYDALSYNPDEDKNDVLGAFYKAIPTLRRGQWCRIVFTSAYGYGSTGMSVALQEQQEYYDAYMQAYYDSYMYESMYGGMYGSGYYNNYYNNYYYNGYYDYYGQSLSMIGAASSSEQQIMTEIQPYTPLIFEIYIEPEEEGGTQ